MTAVYMFAGLLALLVVVGLVLSPLLEREPVSEDRASPAERRDQELEALREVEFEYRTGKLSEEDYRELRARHGEAAVEARRRAEAERPDAGSEEHAPAADVGRGGDAGDAGQEPDRGDGAEVTGTEAGDSEAGPGEAGADEAGAREPWYCPSCGAEARPHARFCSRCGDALGEG